MPALHSTDSQVLGSEGRARRAGILCEDNRVEMWLFSAPSHRPSLTFVGTHSTHVWAAAVFLYT